MLKPMRLRSRWTNPSLAWLLAMGVAGCALPVDIQGKTPITVAGELPPPPPPPPEVPPPPKPPEPPPRVEVRDNKIEIREKIQFEYDKAVIREASFDLMDEIARVIKQNPHIKKLRIEGHASADGEDRYNKSLSDRRAHAVMDHLVQRGGVPATLLIAKGYGEERPVAPNDTEENREKNRRVEFNIVEQDVTKKTVQIDAKTGDEKVVTETQQSIRAPDAEEPEEPIDLGADAARKKVVAEKPTAAAKPVASSKLATTGKPPKQAKPVASAKPSKPPPSPKPAAKPVKTAKGAKPAKPAPAKAANKR